ncbi:MAG: HMG-box domain-containing protein [Planctomycetota bacterium]
MKGVTRIVATVFITIGFCALPSAFALGVMPEGEPEISIALSQFMEETRSGYVSWNLDDIAQKYGLDGIRYMEEYLGDPCDRVMREAYTYMVLVGVNTNDALARKTIVYRLLSMSAPEDEKKPYPIKELLKFTSGDFTEASRDWVRAALVTALVDARTNKRPTIVLLAGVAELKPELPRLKQFMEEHEDKLKQQHAESMAESRKMVARKPERVRAHYAGELKKQYWQSSLVWAALRARARMGVKEDIQRCIDLVESHPDEDYRVTRLLKELSYVRQPEVVDYLRRYLQSDTVTAYKGRDVVVATYGQHAAKALAHMLRGFPGRRDTGGDKETIERCREWMAQQKEWDIIR